MTRERTRLCHSKQRQIDSERTSVNLHCARPWHIHVHPRRLDPRRAIAVAVGVVPNRQMHTRTRTRTYTCRYACS